MTVVDDVATDALSTDEAERVYERFPELRSKCPTCKGRGTYRWLGTEHECDCERQISLAKHYTAAGIHRSFQRMDWDDWHGSDEILNQVGNYLLKYEAYLDNGVGLVIWGDLGTGKTFLANLVMKELVKRRVRCYTSLFNGMVEAFTAGWHDDEDKRRFERKFLYSDALLLDDVGKENRSNNRLPQTTFDWILRTRDQDDRATLLTTNLRDQQLSYGYGASVFSMLRGRNLLVEINADDFRTERHRARQAQIDASETRPIT
jgi:DNA replication protein DnaC